MSKRNLQQLKDLEVKPLFYYVARDTVCLLKREDKIVARGVSSCSLKDQFIKKIGRAKAQGMALKALIRQNSGKDFPHRHWRNLPGIPELRENIQVLEQPMMYCINPSLTPKEFNILRLTLLAEQRAAGKAGKAEKPKKA